MVRAATPDKLTVMTYLHQIKHYFENNNLKNNINSLMSQYSFMTGTEEMLTTKKTNPSKKKNTSKTKSNPKKTKSSSSVKQQSEIDSVTDEFEINCMIEQLRIQERQLELNRINESLKDPDYKNGNIQKTKQVKDSIEQKIWENQNSASFDEDEMLNSMIAQNLQKKKQEEQQTNCSIKNVTIIFSTSYSKIFKLKLTPIISKDSEHKL